MIQLEKDSREVRLLDDRVNWKREICIAVSSAAVFGLLVGLCLAGIVGARSSDLAAWVQSIGSIAAIGGSAWIAARQSREALDREKRSATVALKKELDALQARRSSVIGLCDTMASVAFNASERLQSGGSKQLGSLPGSPLNILRVLETSLASFPFEALESSKGAATLVQMRTLVPELAILMDELVSAARQNNEAIFLEKRVQFIGYAKKFREKNTQLRAIMGFPSTEEPM